MRHTVRAWRQITAAAGGGGGGAASGVGSGAGFTFPVFGSGAGATPGFSFSGVDAILGGTFRLQARFVSAGELRNVRASLFLSSFFFFGLDMSLVFFFSTKSTAYI